jgi:hypothetical protein
VADLTPVVHRGALAVTDHTAPEQRQAQIAAGLASPSPAPRLVISRELGTAFLARPTKVTLKGPDLIHPALTHMDTPPVMQPF